MSDARAARPAVRRTRADVLDAAHAILERQGLPDLTMRRIADALGVQASALYWHFPDKQTLLAALGGRILEETPEPLPSAPSDALVEIGLRLRDRLLSVRDGAELVGSSIALGLLEPAARADLERAATAVGLDDAGARMAADTVLHCVLGFAAQEQQRGQAVALGAARDARPDGDPLAAGLRLIAAGVALAAAAR